TGVIDFISAISNTSVSFSKVDGRLYNKKPEMTIPATNNITRNTLKKFSFTPIILFIKLVELLKKFNYTINFQSVVNGGQVKCRRRHCINHTFGRILYNG